MATKTKSPKQKQFKSAIAALDWLAEQGVETVTSRSERDVDIRREIEELRKRPACELRVIVRMSRGSPSSYEVIDEAREVYVYTETQESAQKRTYGSEEKRREREASRVADENPLIRKKLEDAEAMQLFIWCISRGLKPEIIKVSVPGGEPLEIGLIGAHRPCGGVVITRNGSVMSADRWCSETSPITNPYPNPYMQDLVTKVRKAQAKAADNAKELSANYLNAKNVWFDI